MSLPTLKAALAYPFQLCRSTTEIALLCVASADKMHEHVITVAMPACSDTRLYLVANLISYTPGTLVIGTTEARELVIHAVAPTDRSRDEIAAELERFVEAWT